MFLHDMHDDFDTRPALLCPETDDYTGGDMMFLHVAEGNIGKFKLGNAAVLMDRGHDAPWPVLSGRVCCHYIQACGPERSFLDMANDVSAIHYHCKGDGSGTGGARAGVVVENIPGYMSCLTDLTTDFLVPCISATAYHILTNPPTSQLYSTGGLRRWPGSQLRRDMTRRNKDLEGIRIPY